MEEKTYYFYKILTTSIPIKCLLKRRAKEEKNLKTTMLYFVVSNNRVFKDSKRKVIKKR